MKENLVLEFLRPYIILKPMYMKAEKTIVQRTLTEKEKEQLISTLLKRITQKKHFK